MPGHWIILRCTSRHDTGRDRDGRVDRDRLLSPGSRRARPVSPAGPRARRSGSARRPDCTPAVAGLSAAARHPLDVAVRVRRAGQDEEQVGEPVQILGRQVAGPLRVGWPSAPRRALGPPGDRAGHVQQRRPRGAAGQDEGVQRRQALVVLVAPALEPGHVLLGDPQRRDRAGRRPTGLHRSAPTSNRSFCSGGQHRAQVVGEVAQRQRHARAPRCTRRRRRTRRSADRSSRPPRCCPAGSAGVAGPGVDAGEMNGHARSHPTDDAPARGRHPYDGRRGCDQGQGWRAAGR